MPLDSPAFHLRLMTQDDLTAVTALQAEAYAPHFHESAASFAAKRRFYPQGAWVVETSGGLAGYLFSHPWAYGEPAPLDMPEMGLGTPPDGYYLHDIAVAQSQRGRGLAAALIARGEACARELGLARLAMTSVQGTLPVWARFGYRALALQGPALEKLQTYGPGAVYLVKSI